MRDQPFAAGFGTGERPALMTEELVFEQRVGKGAAVECYEWKSRTRAEVMNGVGNQFFPSAGFTADEHTGAAGCHCRNLFDGLQKAGSLADQLRESRFSIGMATRIHRSP